METFKNSSKIMQIITLSTLLLLLLHLAGSIQTVATKMLKAEDDVAASDAVADDDASDGGDGYGDGNVIGDIVENDWARNMLSDKAETAAAATFLIDSSSSESQMQNKLGQALNGLRQESERGQEKQQVKHQQYYSEHHHTPRQPRKKHQHKQRQQQQQQQSHQHHPVFREHLTQRAECRDDAHSSRSNSRQRRMNVVDDDEKQQSYHHHHHHQHEYQEKHHEHHGQPHESHEQHHEFHGQHFEPHHEPHHEQHHEQHNDQHHHQQHHHQHHHKIQHQHQTHKQQQEAKNVQFERQQLEHQHPPEHQRQHRQKSRQKQQQQKHQNNFHAQSNDYLNDGQHTENDYGVVVDAELDAADEFQLKLLQDNGNNEANEAVGSEDDVDDDGGNGEENEKKDFQRQLNDYANQKLQHKHAHQDQEEQQHPQQQHTHKHHLKQQQWPPPLETLEETINSQQLPITTTSSYSSSSSLEPHASSTFSTYDLTADFDKWQQLTAASARSGRHRGRQAVATNAQVAAAAGKVFRSLPDMEDYDDYEQQQQQQHQQRLLLSGAQQLQHQLQHQHHHQQQLLLQQRHWPVKREAIVEGDLILGGLMMVHSREDTIMCGPIMPQGGIQALEAMLYTIDRINEAHLLPNITLGAHILDDCDKDSYGLEMAVDFIKGSISNIDDAEYHCNKTQVRKVISGVVGAASSVTSIQVANLLRLFRIPQVSFFSTSPELSNKQRFEYFSRTIPSDHYQVKAMVEIVKRMGWSYVSIIYEESNYGIKAFEELEDLLARHNICIAIKEKLVKDSGVAEEIAYDNIVQKLLTKPRARGAIIFGSDQEVREVMRAVRRNNATGAFSWIGSDGWSARNLVSDGNEPEVEGTLSVQPQANPVKGFEEYFLNLTVENNLRNPWFVEFWEDHFQCRYPNSFGTPYNNYNRTCSTKERLSRDDTDFEDQLQFVSDAVMAFAYALRDMHRDLCGGRPSLCDVMKPTKGADLLKYLRKVQFQGLSGDHFRFDNNGDGPARYNIIHFKQSAEGQYSWIKVGEYYEGELRLNMTEVQFKLLHPKPPESVCSLPCERGQAKKYVEGESCCWHCFNCSTYQIRHPTDETQCLTCQLGTLPDASKQFCQTIPEVYLRPESAWAIGAMAFSSTGILVTLFVVGVFVRHNDTPIVRASGRELSYILLAGILMCYAVTFALVLKPTNIVCAIQRFGVGFCFTVVYAALLTKTNRIARIFKAGKQSAKRPSFISPKSQLVICAFLVFVQILINGVWMVIAPSHAMYHHPTREDNLLVCDSYIDASYMIAFFYPILLIVVCTVYAVLTRKIPEAFNESKHIGFTMYTTCVIWLAFVPLYFGTANHVPLRITSMSVTISLSASVTIACLFSPKLYIIIIRPERNVRQSMMPPRHGGMHRTAGTGPSSMMAAAVVTAATCAQEEKIQKHITPTNTEDHNVKAKKLCEMATQTITLSSIFTTMDSGTLNQIPYADQYVPNSHQHNDMQRQQQQQQQQHPNDTHPTLPLCNNNASHHLAMQQQQQEKTAAAEAAVVANNNKINQQQHGTNKSQVTATALNLDAATTTALAATMPASNYLILQQTAATQQQPQQQHSAIGIPTAAATTATTTL